MSCPTSSTTNCGSPYTISVEPVKVDYVPCPCRDKCDGFQDDVVFDATNAGVFGVNWTQLCLEENKQYGVTVGGVWYWPIVPKKDATTGLYTLTYGDGTVELTVPACTKFCKCDGLGAALEFTPTSLSVNYNWSKIIGVTDTATGTIGGHAVSFTLVNGVHTINWTGTAADAVTIPACSAIVIN